MKRNNPKILVIGGVAAGPAAAAKAKRVDPSAEVTLFEQGEFISYGTCSMPYYVGDVIRSYKDLISFTPESFQKEKNCTVKTFHKLEEILPHRKRVIVRDLQSGQADEYPYDQLILATGARARIPNPEWMKAENVFALKNLRDSIRLKESVGMNSSRKVVILGGGFIGMELAEAMSRHHHSVTVIHRSPMPMDSLEPESREIVLNELKRHGVSFVGGENFLDLVIENNRAQYVVTDKGRHEADFVVLALGFEPNSEIAERARIRTGKRKGILTDSRMRTNVDSIFAAGACTEVKNVITNQWTYLPLANLANKTGWIAGENAAGQLSEFAGVVRTTAVKIFDLEAASVGLSAREAEQNDMRVITQTVSGHSRVKAYPGSKPVSVTLIVDRRTKRLLGANLIGQEGAALRADVLSVAIRNEMTIQEVANLDLMYTPPFAPVWDPILVAANKMMKAL